jgi:ribosomal protein S18 acetylase RimI-like enzyme
MLPIADAERQFEKAAQYPFYKFFVAVDGEAVVGTYAILVMDNIGHMGTPSALVESVAVDPTLQGRGIGQAMMDHAMQIAMERGCYKLALSSSIKRTRAHAFYENLGYRRYGYSFGVDLQHAAAP